MYSFGFPAPASVSLLSELHYQLWICLLAIGVELLVYIFLTWFLNGCVRY